MAKQCVVVSLAAGAALLSGCGDSSSPTSVTTTTTPLVGTCGMDDAVTVADCNRPDFGTCGNACCKVSTTINMSPQDVANALNNSLANGGPDGYYTLRPLYEGVQGFAELSGLGFIGQAYHETSGPNHFQDTVNFFISGTGETSDVTVFSLSLIGGALGDAGQTYKNIKMAMDSANFGNGAWSGELTSIGGSCPAPAEARVTSGQDDAAEKATARRLEAVQAVDGTCGLSDPSIVPDCSNVDRGSCGNACCSLTVTVSNTPEEAMSMLNASADSPDVDDGYTRNPMFEGGVGFANLTGIAPASFSPGPIYIGQFNHMTSGPAHFNDTINFNIIENAAGQGSSINVFSVSLVGGAYGDAGQNYKNIKMVLDAAFGSDYTISAGNIENSCPNPTALV